MFELVCESYDGRDQLARPWVGRWHTLTTLLPVLCGE